MDLITLSKSSKVHVFRSVYELRGRHLLPHSLLNVEDLCQPTIESKLLDIQVYWQWCGNRGGTGSLHLQRSYQYEELYWVSRPVIVTWSFTSTHFLCVCVCDALPCALAWWTWDQWQISWILPLALQDHKTWEVIIQANSKYMYHSQRHSGDLGSKPEEVHWCNTVKQHYFLVWNNFTYLKLRLDVLHCHGNTANGSQST